MFAHFSVRMWLYHSTDVSTTGQHPTVWLYQYNMHVIYKNIYSLFTSNSEANASELLVNIKQFPCWHVNLSIKHLKHQITERKH